MKKITIIIVLFTIHCSLFTAYGQTDSLSRYLEIAAQNNPSVKAAFLSYEAALQKIPQMGAYEDPQLDIGFFLKPMDLVDGRQIAQFQLMQMFPWFGTKKAAQTEAHHMAKMTFEEFRESRDNLFLEVYTQWYALCALQQKRINSEENKKLLQQLESLAVRKFSTGSGGGKTEDRRQKTEDGKQEMGSGSTSGMNMGASQTASGNSSGNQENRGGMNMSGGASSGMSEVLRVQLELVESESNIESLLSEIIAAKARFNALLNRSADHAVNIPDEFSQIPYLLDVSSVSQQMTEQNPMLGMLKEESLAHEARLEMEKKMAYPMFGVGLQYMLIGKTPESAANGADMGAMDNGITPDANGKAMKSMNGKDMIMPMVSVSIPIFRNKYKAAQRESRLLRQASEEKYADTFNRLQAELYRDKHLLDDAVRKIALYKKQSALALTTCELVIQEFASGKSELSDVIQVQRQLLDYRLKEAEAIATYNTMVANIQKLISSNDK
ncbi:MAG: TolC family protein [Dysgonamonadaceae bacterium]|jgi:outer membrane protein TolC|nr:TolC family protein [Dysgonamonadaceae bacterium]